MKLRDKILYMTYGAGLVVLGMVLNSFLIDDANAGKGSIDAKFGKVTCQELEVSGKSNFFDNLTAVDIYTSSVGAYYITCRDITIVDENGKKRGRFGLSVGGDAILSIYGDDGKTEVAYLGGNAKVGDEMMLKLKSKSKTDKRIATMMIDENGGRFDAVNKLGESVASIAVGNKGGGVLGLRDKHGYDK